MEIDNMAEFTTKGVGNAGLSLGIIGTALSVMNGGLGNLFNGLGRNTGDMVPCENQFVTRYEMGLENKIQDKDSEIAILKSERYTDTKLIEVYKDLESRINALKDGQAAINTQQSVYNATINANLSCLTNQVSQISSVFKIIIPAANVCPQPMPLHNSWTAPTAGTTT